MALKARRKKYWRLRYQFVCRISHYSCSSWWLKTRLSWHFCICIRILKMSVSSYKKHCKCLWKTNNFLRFMVQLLAHRTIILRYVSENKPNLFTNSFHGLFEYCQHTELEEKLSLEKCNETLHKNDSCSIITCCTAFFVLFLSLFYMFHMIHSNLRIFKSKDRIKNSISFVHHWFCLHCIYFME